MDALDWPLTRMRSLHLYFGGWSESNPQNQVRDDPYLLLTSAKKRMIDLQML